MKNALTAFMLILALPLIMNGQNPANGLIASYPFNGTGDDASGTGHDGTVYGASLTTDRFNQPASAYSFDGVDDEILLSGTFGGTSEIAVSAWFLVYGTTNDFQAIFESNTAAIDPVLHLQLNTFGNNVVYTGTYPSQSVIFLPILYPTPYQEWRHVVLSVKSGETRLYQNGILVGQNPMTYSVITQNSMKIGSGCPNGRYFKGKIDDLRVFNRALSATEVAALYNETLLSVNAGPENQVVTLGYQTIPATLSAVATGGTPPYSYSWSTGNTSATITVLPEVATTYTVTVTDAFGQTATDDVSVDVLDWRCGNNQNKVTLCHNGQTICVASEAVQAHLDHGDYIGGCQISKNAVRVPTEFSLSQNFPNPFNPSTVIEYGIPEDGDVQLRVYDLFGQEVTRLAEESKHAGTYQVSFDGSSLPSGVFVYRLEWDGKVITRKMTLLK